METLPTNSPEITTNQEVVPLAEARFLDLLEDQYEELWLSLLQNANIVKDTNYMTPLWMDEEAPQVFRDRAMLMNVGTWDLKKMWGIGSISGNFGLYPFMSMTKHPLPFEEVKLFDWEREALEYEKRSGKKLLSDATYLHDFKTMFWRKHIKQEEFESMLGHIDIVAASPTMDDNDYPLDRDRFPLLDDLVYIYKDHPLKSWAKDQLRLWFASHSDPTIVLPKWYEQVNSRQAQHIVKKILPLAGEEDAIVGYDAFWPFVERYGWERLIDRYHTMKTVKNMRDEPMQVSLLVHFLSLDDERQEHIHLKNDDISFIEQLAARAGEIKLSSLAEAARKKYETREVERQKYIGTLKVKQVERERGQELEAAIKDNASRRLKGILEVIKKL